MSDAKLSREKVTDILDGYHAGCPCETTPGGFCENYIHGARLLAHDAALRAALETAVKALREIAEYAQAGGLTHLVAIAAAALAEIEGGE